MWRGRAPVSTLMLLTFFLCFWCSLQGQGLYEPSPPVNLSITSSNFHTVLKWDVVDASRALHFNVDFSDYESGEWKPFPPCLNISTHQCDLSEAFLPITMYASGYYARVNVVTKSNKLVFARTNRFTFSSNATLDPPDVHLAADGNEIIVELKPAVPNSTTDSINKTFKKLSYIIYYGDPGMVYKVGKEVCPKPKRCPKIKVPGGITCVSAEAHLFKLKLTGKRSRETCLQIHPSNISASSVAVLATIISVIVLLLLAGIIFFVCKFHKKEQVLPKSLAHIIKGGKTYSIVTMKTEESSISVLTEMEKVTNVNEVDLHDETQVEMIKASSDIVAADPVIADAGNSETVNADLNDPYAAKIEISSTDQKSDREDNIEKGNRDLDSNHDLCKTNSDNVKQICAADNWGYDKPQILFDAI
ncbi:interferon gamma receptor 1-like isoform X2 [Heterodontus francisci]|uniref:interferon gamma receptor 1-like isoform X2 n=1 Tax=Heterodontus francisci TaxID=7792 RepID=UPI00355C9B88